LVPNDTNGIEDIFVYDFQTGTTMRVSVDSSGNESTGGVGSNRPGISADGRYVAFESSATNLVGASDTNGDGDIFVHDRQTGATIRVSVDSSGNQANGSSGRPAISADGRFVAFESLAQNLVAGGTLFKQIFVHDIQTGLTTLVSVDNSSTQGNADSALATISGDGRFVAFVSLADNLVAGDTNGTPDIFVHDRQTGTTSRVSVDSSGNESNGTNPNSPDISADGRFVAFQSDATDLVAGDTNGVVDVFVHDRQTGTTTRISVDSAGTEGNAQSREPSLSADGRFVAFHSDANLVAGDTNGLSDIYLHDRQTGVTSRISLPAIGIDTNGNSFRPRISPDGQFVVFQSVADNLISLDQNALSDVFVHDLQTGITTRISVDSSGTEDGKYVTLQGLLQTGLFSYAGCC
jgi:Tol biopolymer transport system component